MTAKTLIEAMGLWEATGTQIAQTAKETSELLARNGIPNLVAGGIAVQLHGYPRFTNDVDLIVPDVQAAHEALLAAGFRPSLIRMLAVLHPTFRVTIDLLPGGKCLQRACQVNFPMPTDVTAVMQPVSLEDLVSLKLDSYLRSPARRGQDRTDVEKLIINNRLPRDLMVHPAMAAKYNEVWDAIAAESAADPEMPEA